jgi:hypothetical protein
MPPRLFTPEKVARIVQTARAPQLSAFSPDQLGERLEECANQFTTFSLKGNWAGERWS